MSMTNEELRAAWALKTDAEKIACYEEEYSDFFKEAHGFRPRHSTEGWTLQTWERAFKSLESLCEMNAEREREQEAAAITKFDQDIAKIIAMGAADRDTAIRWMIDDEEDIGYFCYCRGLPYNYLDDYRRRMRRVA